MNLIEILNNINNLDDELVIYAVKNPNWEMSSPAIALPEPDINKLPSDLKEMSYFLEVDIVKEVLEVWSQWRNGQKPSNNEKFEAVVYYAENDAYIE